MTENKRPEGNQTHDELLTIQEVADRLKCTTRTVRSLINEGELSALFIGRSRMKRVRVSAVDKLMTNVRAADQWTA